MNHLLLVLGTGLLALQPSSSQLINPFDPIAPIKGFVQANLAGYPILHEKQTWIFDPDVSLRRRKEFEEINGIRAHKLIERLGLGIDGYGEERLKKQRLRDEELSKLNNNVP